MKVKTGYNQIKQLKKIFNNFRKNFKKMFLLQGSKSKHPYQICHIRIN